MLKRAMETDETKNCERSSQAASDSLFADAYNLPPTKERGQAGAGDYGAVRSTARAALPKGGPGSEAGAAGGDGDDLEPAEYDDFPYEMIFRNVSPELHTLAQGETLETLSRQHLGPQASNEEVERHRQEIRELNSGETMAAGTRIVLPGHTAEGDVVMPLKDGSTYTISGDPVELDRQAAEPVKPPVATRSPAGQD